MLFRAARLIFSCITLIAFASSLGIPKLRAEEASPPFGKGLSDLVGNAIVGILGITYKQTPMFKQYVLPYVKDMALLDTFMQTYNYKNNLSERESIDLVVKLGVVKFKPEWLNTRSIELIDKYYPGLRTKRSFFDGHNTKLAGLCGLPLSETDSCSYAVAIVGVDDIVILTGLTALTVGVLTLNGLSKSHLLDRLTPQGQQAIQAAEAQLCATSNSCSPVNSATPDQSITGPSVGAGGSGDCEPSQQQSMQRQVDAFCKPLPKQCAAGDSCSSVRQRVLSFSSCANARQSINNTCYRGGNNGHQQAYTFARQQADICKGMLPACKAP